jgi:hypothetical protein
MAGRLGVWGLLAGILWGVPAFGAPTLEELRKDPDLTPERLVGYFRDFAFKLGDQLQAPETFLANEEGDCDDFATVASMLLRERKFTTRLVAVFMEGQTHVVCYVSEVGAYLDFNLRAEEKALQKTDGRLEDMAEKVASYFRSPWRFAAEVTYQEGARRLGAIAFRGGPVALTQVQD